MARIASTTSAGVPTGSTMTLDALMARQKQLAEAGGKISADRQMISPWQGAAYLGDVFANKVNQGRADRAVAEGRQTLAERMAGVSMEDGATAEQIAQVSQISPEHGMQLWKMAAEALQARRAREQQLADRTEQRSYDERIDQTKWDRLQADQIGDEQRQADAKAAEDARVAKAGKLRIVTGEDAAAMGGDPSRQYRVSEDGTKLEDITPDVETYRPPTPEEIEQYRLKPDQPVRVSNKSGKVEAIGTAPQISATTQKQIVETDDDIGALQATIDDLTGIISGPEGQALNDRAGSGNWATMQAWAARNDPTGFFDDAKGEATTELNSVVMGSALQSLKAIFGGNPTEGERAALLELQASANKSPRERRQIIQRALVQANKKLALLEGRSDGLRGGDYFKPGGGIPARADDDDFEVGQTYSWDDGITAVYKGGPKADPSSWQIISQPGGQ